ncbi:MAG: carboxylating nicotinate-nucleotide diphosphorylase [Candidatus Lokiarchaeota archaeon]|nr:carboxylating nicotinate-nucleotide diphosphorylase [Candidatus Lokiarchaeota archaeon]
MHYNKIVIKRKLKEFIEEDCQFKDCSSDFIPETDTSSARIISKSEGYISGLEELEILFGLLKVNILLKKKDGDSVSNGDLIAELNGLTRNILLGERIGLNLCTHMSAITSTTKKFTNIVKEANKNTRIACTRKTLPGLRIFEKKAVEIGGGETHRFSLDDMILLKDTHLKYRNGDLAGLLEDVKKKASFSKKIEVEIEKINDIVTAAKNGADIVMLDNMTPKEVKEAINLLENQGLRNKILIEVSGGINFNNFRAYLDAEPDIISTSELTQNPFLRVDLSLRFN